MAPETIQSLARWTVEIDTRREARDDVLEMLRLEVKVLSFGLEEYAEAWLRRRGIPGDFRILEDADG